MAARLRHTMNASSGTPIMARVAPSSLGAPSSIMCGINTTGVGCIAFLIILAVDGANDATALNGWRSNQSTVFSVLKWYGNHATAGTVNTVSGTIPRRSINVMYAPNLYLRSEQAGPRTNNMGELVGRVYTLHCTLVIYGASNCLNVCLI